MKSLTTVFIAAVMLCVSSIENENRVNGPQTPKPTGFDACVSVKSSVPVGKMVQANVERNDNGDTIFIQYIQMNHPGDRTHPVEQWTQESSGNFLTPQPSALNHGVKTAGIYETCVTMAAGQASGWKLHIFVSG